MIENGVITISGDTLARLQRRKRRREELEAQGIVLGCHQVESAKEKNARIYKNTGRCPVCQHPASECTCDDRSAWVKRRKYMGETPDLDRM